MELRQMRCFAALAEELHFGRAAATLSMAQPALSVQIQTLEKELGVQLLIRSTRRVELTKAGEVFYERCIRVLREIENSSAIVRAVAGKDVDRITIGTIYPATFGVLPLFLSKLGKRFPDVEIHVSAGSTDAIIRDLEKGRINLGFIRPVENIGSLRWQSIANERYLLAVPLGSPLATAETVAMSDLKQERIISFSRSNLSYTEKYFFEQFRKHGLLDHVAYSCDDTLSLVSLVSAGIGVGFVPEWTKDLPNRSFHLREVKGVDFTIGMGLAWNKEDPTANRDEILEIARSLGSLRKPVGKHSEGAGKKRRLSAYGE
ncbi:Chromosome initiation inhibitor (plasmid) [Sinorhizobium sojae CCBAU 05684]|uniref:Chromosome initiation inhibitor n=1 Tax=Sinorhizobium sojae CCBAU 05684 TaxID=716928 RepID=A0A249PKL9_9HYPH|nr:LysR family transcriptional regulator [Sinorhizobium sojae]ASY66234.1 Chromosome initiation inhibitor [Sinorhizobium sojae CCBAU 05684]